MPVEHLLPGSKRLQKTAISVVFKCLNWLTPKKEHVQLIILKRITTIAHNFP